jgi:signal transduction histidine kinase
MNRWTACVALAGALVSCRSDVTPPVSLSIGEVSRLAAQGVSREVELRGVVTYFDRTLGIVYVQDDSGAQAFEVGNPGAPLVRGQTVVLSGEIESQAPFHLRHVRVTVLGRTEVQPKVRAVDFATLIERKAEAEWVYVYATVRAVERHGDSAVLDLDDGPVHGRALIDVFGDPNYPDLTGARVRLGGTSLIRAHMQRLAKAVDLIVPSLQDVRIEQDGPVAPPSPSDPTLPLLTTAAAVRALSSTEAGRGYPIHLNAVVTFNDPEQALLFVQDQTAGIYVEAWRHIHPLHAGDRVEIEGRSAAGSFAPIVEQPRVRFVTHERTPPARHVRPGQWLTGSEDGQWLEVEGIVRGIRFDRFGSLLRIADGAVRLTVEVPKPADPRQPDPMAAAPLLNARIRARGVCRSVLTADAQLAHVVLHSPDLQAIDVISPAPSVPFVHPLNTLLRFQPGVVEDWEHQVRAQGTVTYSRPGELYIQDDSGSVFVHSPQLPRLQIGDLVEAIGFAAAADYKPMLEDAQVRFVSHGRTPQPAAVSPEQIFSGQYDATLVTLDARLVDSVGGRDEQQLLMQAGPYLFTAVLPGPHVDVRPGSELRVSGVSALSTGDRAPQSFRLWLRTPADVVVLHRAPFWNPRRAAWAVAAMAVVIGLGTVWLVTLRRRVQAQAAVIWERVKRETELQERQRMARELHDTLEQNLSGIGFCLEAVDRALVSHPEIARRQLALAIDQVTAGADEVRRCVWALRTPSLETGGLAGALDEIGQQLARCGTRPIEVRASVSGRPRPFATSTENHLLRIGQEALTNAVRHGQAAHVGIELRYERDAFVLSVEDDGRGFDAQRPVLDGHFGLAGMRERADAMGAHLDLRSVPGRGTRVEITVPLEPLAHRLAEGA